MLSYVKGVDIILMALEIVSNAHTTFKNRMSKNIRNFCKSKWCSQIPNLVMCYCLFDIGM